MLKENGFYKGVNLGGWLSQCDYSEQRLTGFITENDFKKLGEWGIDHVRLPIDYNVVEDENGGISEKGFALIEKAVANAHKNGLNVVLDLHKTAGFSFDDYGEDEHGFFDSETLQERFYRLWEEFAKRFGSDEGVAFELLNEVTDKSFIGSWNEISNTCIKRIRKIAPKTIILIGSYHNNSAHAVPDLDAPHDDRVAYNFHCYEPLEFTHQGAYWITSEDFDKEKRISFDELELDEEFFEKLFSPAIKKAEQENTELYCGEYGVIDIASPEDALKWFEVINRVFERHGIARAAWSYKQMDFGISDKRMDGVRERLIRVL